jgi:hypothetical protein
MGGMALPFLVPLASKGMGWVASSSLCDLGLGLAQGEGGLNFHLNFLFFIFIYFQNFQT